MHRASAQLLILLLLPLVLDGCSRERDAGRRQPGQVLVNALKKADSPLRASLAIAEAELSSCAAALRGLLALQEGPWEGSALRGLVEEILHRSSGACDAAKTLDWAPGAATSLARSLIVGEPTLALEALAKAPRVAVILRRESELLFALGRDAEGREVLIDSLALEDDEEARALAARLLRMSGELERSLWLCGTHSGQAIAMERVAALSALGRSAEVHDAVEHASIHLRTELASAAVASSKDVTALAMEPKAGPELLLIASAAQGVSTTASVAFLRRATALQAQDAELWIALAEMEEKVGALPAAIVAWDRAAALAPGAVRPVLAPIRILTAMGERKASQGRATKLAALARSTKNSEELHWASLASRYAGEHALAVTLAKEALAIRPGEGRLQSELAHRLVEAKRGPEAAIVLSSLLVCGSRGRPWHRHEVAARLVALVDEEALAASLAKVPCKPVEQEDLRSHLPTKSNP